MTFNYKYALFTNTPVILVAIIYPFIEIANFDPVWAYSLLFIALISWCLFTGENFYDRHPNLDYHNYRRGLIPMVILISTSLVFIYLFFKLGPQNNLEPIFMWIALSNFLTDGFAKYKGIE
ncbi:hypothetical protein [Lentilactobacillus kefiri]|uniref:Uncharacterized protein n=1 Tax=Lentilactobacillus kefiri TaxID=33962 RepID=A0A511DTU0_LENKE|nr:hypothetical protein [Lentilactobacillus kefiri]MCJ2161321.1 hypothetical protein [Lentilactobacillus kefiri]MCP9368805.1 hypothetical protein [Lentilactobacillus kefiri]MDH5108862.1 hypothetical protein [Lentilactobacillus kefiri]MDM7492478.1 hypothetical protein [Lentilactobacillus kefiri]PAK59444.1 hypothetical protein B9K02_06195 [Lentilactobacillus kefiri]